MSFSFYLVFPVMAILAILQSTILPHFPVFGVVPQLWFLATMAWAMVNGLEQGFLWAFVAGIFIDLFSAAPIGVTSLSLMAAVAIAVFLQRHLPQNRIILPAILMALATFVFWFVYLFLLRIIVPLNVNSLQFLGAADLVRSARFPDLLGDIAGGYALSGQILQYVIVIALLNAFLIVPIYWGLSTLVRFFRPRQVEI